MKLSRSALLCLLSSCLSSASPVDTERKPKQSCNQDNCLRQIMRVGAPASSYCKSSVLVSKTTTITVTPTVFSVYQSTILPTHVVQAFTKIPPAVTPLPTFAGFCDTAPTRISSACGCLLSTTAPTVSTVTKTAAPVSSTVCGPSDNYGIVYQPGSGDFYSSSLPANSQAQNPQLDFPTYFTENNGDVKACCQYCYTYFGKNCVNYGIAKDSIYCNLVVTLGSSNPTPDDQVCPAGMSGNVGPIRTDPENAYYGNGPCSYEVQA